jgi:hypothetical protein
MTDHGYPFLFSLINKASGTQHIFTKEDTIDDYGLANSTSLFSWLPTRFPVFSSTLGAYCVSMWSAYKQGVLLEADTWACFVPDPDGAQLLFTVVADTDRVMLYCTTFKKVRSRTTVGDYYRTPAPQAPPFFTTTVLTLIHSSN